ncbi:MAG: electron transport complex subunit RsxE [Clostridia bacterium]|nr:electron transport complex subunit RsxE [Clostridia bacterium]
MKTNLKHFINGFVKENPVFVLLLGTCPTLATTTSVISALAMGLAAAAVLICSNAVISLLRKVIPDKVRIPAYIVIIAGFVTVVQMLMEAYLPSLYDMLGVYLALIVVNCIVLGRAEMFASKHGVGASVLDGAGMGLGFTFSLLLMATVREVFGAGSFAGVEIPLLSDYAIPILVSPPGGFFVFGMLIAIVGKLSKKPVKAEFGCEGCPNAAVCKQSTEVAE